MSNEPVTPETPFSRAAVLRRSAPLVCNNPVPWTLTQARTARLAVNGAVSRCQLSCINRLGRASPAS